MLGRWRNEVLGPPALVDPLMRTPHCTASLPTYKAEVSGLSCSGGRTASAGTSPRWTRRSSSTGRPLRSRSPGSRAGRENTERLPHCQRALQARLDPLAREMRLGQVVISADFRRLPPTREIAVALGRLGDEVAGAMQGLPSEPTDRTDMAVPVSVDFVRFLDLVQCPAERHRVSWITGSAEWGGRVEPMADEFVQHLLVTKPKQTAGYEEAWIVVVDRSALVDADNLRHRTRTAHGRHPSELDAGVLPALNEWRIRRGDLDRADPRRTLLSSRAALVRTAAN